MTAIAEPLSLADRIQIAQDVAKVVAQAAVVFHATLHGLSAVDRRKAMCEFVRSLTIAEASPYAIDPNEIARSVMFGIGRTGLRG